MEELVAAEDVDVEGIITGIAVLVETTDLTMMMMTLMIDTIALMNNNMNAIHVNASMKMKLDMKESSPTVFCVYRQFISLLYTQCCYKNYPSIITGSASL